MRLSVLMASLTSVTSAFTQRQSVLQGNKPLSDEVSSTSLDSIIAKSPLLSLHRSLCETKGISNHEQSVGDFLTAYLTERNFTVEKQVVPFDGDDYGDEEPPRFNVLAYPSWQNHARPEIILTSHIDTVPPYIPYSLSIPDSSSKPPSRKDILISGRGTVDAKASVAAQVIAAETYLREHSEEAKLGLLFVVSEEGTGSGMTFFSNSDLNRPSKGDEAGGYHTLIFGEPTERTLASGHKGSLGFSVSAKGKSAHSGYPWLGKSAVSRILPILQRLDSLGVIPEKEGGLPRSEKYGNSTVNIGLMRGGVATNVVPASAHAAITLRVAGGTVEEVRQVIEKAVFADGDDEGDVKLTFTHGAYSPVDLNADVEGFEVKTMNYGTDVPHLDVNGGHDSDRFNVKRYLYGPGTIFVAHGEDEALTVGELEAGYEGYLKLIDAAVQRGTKL